MNKQKISRFLIKFQNQIQDSQLYIQKMLERKESDIIVNHSRIWAQTIGWTMMGGTSLAIAWLALAKTEEIVIAPGRLEPISGVIDVQMPLQGIAKNIYVEDGDKVKKGDILIVLDTEQSEERKRAIEESIKLKRQELEYKEAEYAETITTSQLKLRALQSSRSFARLIKERYRKLLEEGALAELQYLEAEERLEKIENEIKVQENDKFILSSVMNQQIKSLKGQLADLESKRTDAKVTLKYQNIISPIDGIVFDSQVQSPGYVARSTEPILKIVPIEKLQANVEIPSRSIGFVKKGILADISIDSYPATDFGVIAGVVKAIGSDALEPESRTGKSYRFPTTIELKDQSLVLKNGKELPLQVGMSLTANIKLRKVSYLQLLLGGFRNKADSIREL